MTKVLTKIVRLPSRCFRQLKRHMNGRRLGLFFVRARSFRMPQSVNVAGTTIALHYPPEHGVEIDFFTCCIGNTYGLHERLSNSKTILDIGANVGFFSIAARSHYPQAQIHAYEPNPRVLPFLKANVEPLSVTVYPEAVGSDSGQVSMFDAGDSNQAKTILSDTGSIPQISLKSAIERIGGSVDLLKLDCEGAEWDMFQSTEPWRNVRNIRMEYHLVNGKTIQDVKHALDHLGFEPLHWAPDRGFGIVWARSR